MNKTDRSLLTVATVAAIGALVTATLAFTQVRLAMPRLPAGCLVGYEPSALKGSRKPVLVPVLICKQASPVV